MLGSFGSDGDAADGRIAAGVIALRSVLTTGSALVLVSHAPFSAITPRWLAGTFMRPARTSSRPAAALPATPMTASLPAGRPRRAVPVGRCSS